MLCRVILVAAAVCVGGVCTGAASRVLVPRDYRVKLCGREFIRAVIFTCGGSRWRRDAQRHSDPLQWSSFSDVSEQNDLLAWQQGGADLMDRSSPVQISSHFSLSDLLALFGLLGDRQQPAERLQQPTLSELQGGDAARFWSRPVKKKRHFSLGMAGMCCDQGCTKNDIGRLC